MTRLSGLGLAVKSPAEAGGGQSLTMPTIAATTVLYAPMVHRGTVRIVYAAMGESPTGVSTFSIPLTVPDSDNLGFMLFFNGEELPEEIYISVAVGSGGEVIVRNSLPQMYAYVGSLPSGEDELHINRAEATTYITWAVIVVDGVNEGWLDTATGDEESASSEIALSATYATNSLYVGASWGWNDGGDFTQEPVSGVFSIATGAFYPGASSYHLSLLAMPISGAVTADFGVTNTPPAADAERTVGYYVKGIQGALTLPTIAAGTTLYPPAVILEGQTINMPTIAAATVLYGPTRMTSRITMPTIAATALYAPSLSYTFFLPTIAATTVFRAPSISGPPTNQFLIMTFLGLGTPNVFNMPTIASTALYAPAITTFNEIEMDFIVAATVLFAPVLTRHASTATGAVYPPVSVDHV